MMKSRRVLVLSPHTDDGEISAGGTIAKMIEEGKELFYIAFQAVKNLLSRVYLPKIS